MLLCDDAPVRERCGHRSMNIHFAGHRMWALQRVAVTGSSFRKDVDNGLHIYGFVSYQETATFE